MAVFYPDLESIHEDKMEKHTAGELQLLDALTSLDDTYNVYYQPHINYAHPDIIIEKEACGILIIEVKDWNLKSYSFFPGAEGDKYGYLTVQGQPAKLSTPFQQVQEYKDELFTVLSPSLYVEKLKKETRGVDGEKASPVYGVVKTAVYFSMASDNDVISLFSTADALSSNYGRKQYDRYTTYWTSDDQNCIVTQVEKLLKCNESYVQPIHDEVSALFYPSSEWAEQTQSFTLTKKQEEFAKCQPGRKVRLRGGAGSGKTLVLAQKAINCYRAKGSPVLILTYNITLKNYIRDKIAANTREMSQSQRDRAFERIHFDSFLSQMIRKHGLKGPSINDYSTDGKVDWNAFRAEQMSILEQAGGLITRYDTIVIDEAQDYETEWFTLISKLFLAPNADYLIVADEKQNIYSRQLDQETKMPIVNGFTGRWNRLEESHRLSNAGIRLATSFQERYFSSKYNIDKPQQLDMFSLDDRRSYIHIDGFNAEMIFALIQNFRVEDPPISPNDICILTSDVAKMRQIDKSFRDHLGKKATQTVCETQEVYLRLCEVYGINDHTIAVDELDRRRSMLESELKQIRHMKKNAFNMNPGSVKISTVHSFKGWEINTVVLIIDETDVSDEVVYTAITRAKKNLLVIDCSNNRYSDFFVHEFAQQ